MTRKQITQLGGRGLFEHYSSLAQILRKVFPNHPWQPLEFNRAKAESWKDVANQRLLLEQIGDQLGVKEVRPTSLFYNLISKMFSYPIGIQFRQLNSPAEEVDDCCGTIGCH